MATPTATPTARQTTFTTQSTIACDGGELGHPRVFLNLGDGKPVDCPYCGQRYAHRPDPQMATRAPSSGH